MWPYEPAIEDALALTAKRQRSLQVEIIRDVPDATLWVEAGETRLRQVLSNLISNALDALSEKACRDVFGSILGWKRAGWY